MEDTLLTPLEQRIVDAASSGQRLPDQMMGDGTANMLAENRARDLGTGNLIKRGFRSLNAATGIVQAVERAFVMPDADFDLEAEWEELTVGIPEEFKDQFNSVRSREEGLMLRDDIMNELDDMAVLGSAGARGMVASGLATIIDVDLPLMFFSGGSYAGPKVASALARTGMKSNRVTRGLTLGAAGFEAGLVSQTANTLARPTGQWTDIPDAALGGLAFGTILGAALPKSFSYMDDQVKKAQQEFGEAKATGFQDPVAVARAKPVRKETRLSTNEEVEIRLKKAEAEGLEDTLSAFPDSPVTNEGAISLSDGALVSNKQALKDRGLVRKFTTVEGESYEGVLAEDLWELRDAYKSVGAAQVTPDKSAPYTRQSTGKRIAEMQKRNVDEGLTGDVWELDSYFNTGVVGQSGKALYKGVVKTPFATDFDRLWNSESVLAASLAVRLFESPSGVGRAVNRTAAILEDEYITAIHGPVARQYRPSFVSWLKEQKDTTPTELAWNDASKVDAFNREVMLEQAYRYHEGRSNPASSQSVRDLADAFDEAAKKSVEVNKGQDGETPVFGAEDLEHRTGWMRQVWSGSNMQRAIIRAEDEFGIKNGKQAIEQALATSYRNLHGWNKKLSNAVAGAVVSRALAHAEGANTSLFRTMTFEDGNYIKELLEANGHSADIVDTFMKQIKGKLEDRKKNPALKHRNDIDPRTPIEGTDMTIMDLLDTDLEKVWNRHARSTAGAAGLARNGFQFHELDEYLLDMQDELRMKGHKPFKPEFIESIKTYFSGGAFSGGIDPNIRRMNQVSGLALLNGMGLTQLGELGNSIGMAHLDNFIAAAPAEVKAVFGKKRLPVHDQLQYVDSSIIGDHLIKMPHKAFDELRISGQPNGLEDTLDTVLAKGRRIQGYTSLFYKINQAMQAATRGAITHRVWKIANKKDKGFSDKRWEDVGFRNGSQERFLKYFRDGTVEVVDNRVVNYHPDKWDNADWREFSTFLLRVANQGVQRSFRGEDAYWLHRGFGGFMMHLKSFTFTATHKQLIRNMRLADPEALGSFFWGLGTAAAAYSARQHLNGRGEDLDGEKLVRGMLNYSGMVAPVIQFSDPMLGIMGLGDYQIGNFHGAGKYGGGSTNLISVPPQYNVINRIGNIPNALVRGATGNLEKNDIYALQATPIVGNMYGVGMIAKLMRDDIDKRKREEKKRKREQKDTGEGGQ